MPSNKARLYVALYPSGVVGNEERRYHWGFLIGPKSENTGETPGTRCHVRNSPGAGWQYEETVLRNVQSTINLLARIVIAKIEDEDRLVEILRSLPVIQSDPTWRCRTWIASALTAIAKDGKAVGTSELDWSKIETFAREYVARKHASGRYGVNTDMLAPKPTYDLMTGQETVS